MKKNKTVNFFLCYSQCLPRVYESLLNYKLSQILLLDQISLSRNCKKKKKNREGIEREGKSCRTKNEILGKIQEKGHWTM
ncbi:hypothetical protein ACE6H2_011857 [Prunus campanulata]